MAWSTELEELLPHTVTVTAMTGVSTDGYMTPVYSTASSTYSARVVGKQELVRTFEGTEELARTIAWVATTSTFGPFDKVVLPGSTSQVTLLAVESFSDEDGAHHVRLAFGDAR